MQKPKSFRPWQPEQTTLLPPALLPGMVTRSRK